MSSSQMKLRRRMCKYQNIVMNDYGISLSQFPTEILMICNGGLVNGINQEIVFETFSGFGQIENIIMLPGKSYCFILFKDLCSAEEVFKKFNNNKIWQSIKGPIYLAFAEALPESLNIQMNFDEKPPGLFVLEDFVTKEDETSILKCVEGYSAEWERSSLKNRRVSHFGYEFQYSNNNVDVEEPIRGIPKELDFIWDKLQEMSPKLGLSINFRPDQLTVNNYQPGQGIPPHVDTHSAFEDPIVSLSLQSSVIMEFRNCEGKCCSVLLPARSICIMSGDSRYGWTHGIATRKSDIVPGCNGGLTLRFREERTSFTFRKIKGGSCDCDFPRFCDARLGRNVPQASTNTVNDGWAKKLEENYVHQVYEKISDHFSETRHKPWPNVLKFVQNLPAGSILVDVGCGNGKYFNKGCTVFEIGFDASLSLMEVCRQRGFECFTSNCLSIPLRNDIADACISIAVIHHLVTEERRKRAISEIMRILRPKGRALIYVWAKNQDRFNKKSSYLKRNSRKDVSEGKNVVLEDIQSDLTLPVHTNRTNFAHNDLLVPWKLKEKTGEVNAKPVYLRYYHVFEDDELRELCSGLSNTDIVEYYYDEGNWCIILQKT